MAAIGLSFWQVLRLSARDMTGANQSGAARQKRQESTLLFVALRRAHRAACLLGNLQLVVDADDAVNLLRQQGGSLASRRGGSRAVQRDSACARVDVDF